MKSYEYEVISLPASSGIDAVEKYGVYTCPMNKRFEYKSSLYVAFRESGGTMRTLYKVRSHYEMLPDRLNISTREMDDLDRKQILAYLNDKKFEEFTGSMITLQFFVLDLKHVIKLPACGAHSYKRASQGRTYYYLSDMLDPDKCQKLKPCSKC